MSRSAGKEHLSFLSTHQTMVLGRLIHYSVDALLVSTLLASVKRSSGISLSTSKIENQDVRAAVEKYLDAGDWIIDYATIVANSAPFFERKR